ncbi:hypothetical protein BPNPMPFG_002404 [Mesorhizobium sp. AR07]|uniref:hypothetical protein n=1 Tax=Mesorhizobium sp. AR07 TaxID=2865838 RepID=UPI00215E40C0|nr:hypothetical protein [Mesorhizobium sp. AR07]UVK46702.1 hypothetical protein BPNPMPFG_002404 [Mesorhizobium sp. AR07]
MATPENSDDYSYKPPGYQPPALTYTASLYKRTRNPASPCPAPAAAPAPAPLKVLPGNAVRFREIVLQVQFAILPFGVLGSDLRPSLMKMQADYNLMVTGTINRIR